MLRALIEGIAAATPGQCAVCRAWPAQPVCEACVARFAQPLPRCRRCALPVPGGVAECGVCLRAPPPLDACHAAVTYGFPWSGLLSQFKFRGEAGWAATIATLMRSAPWIEPALDQGDLVLPMPLAPRRLAERGFNQALELARRLSPQKTDARLLLRIRDTAQQSALERRDRLLNVKHAFALDPLQAARVRGKRVVLVDDVMTSGSSLHAAARVVRAGGAAHITALVFARTDEPE